MVFGAWRSENRPYSSDPGDSLGITRVFQNIEPATIETKPIKRRKRFRIRSLLPFNNPQDGSEAEVYYLKIPETVKPKNNLMNRYFRI